MAEALTIHFDFDKAATLQPGVGYDAPPPGTLLRGIVWHSTEHQAGQSFAGVCAYLRDSRDVSVHYVVGYDGTVQRVLDPRWTAWGAGRCWYNGQHDFNTGYVQIELYHRKGGPDYPAVQLAAAQALARELMADHPTIRPSNMVCHRWIAVWPNGTYGRRDDPTDRSDSFWRTWFAGLAP